MMKLGVEMLVMSNGVFNYIKTYRCLHDNGIEFIEPQDFKREDKSGNHLKQTRR